MREEDLYCEDVDENRGFNRYHRLAKNQSSESDGYTDPIEHEDADRPSRRSSNYFDAIWEGRTR